jgi:FKBP12-rapamycin complex-associated protein
LQSSDSTKNLLALHAIVALIDLPFGGPSKFTKLANFLRNVFEVKRDPEILVPASTVLGHLANVGGALTARQVEQQVSYNNWFQFSSTCVFQFSNTHLF